MKIAFIADLHIDRHKNYQSQDFIDSLNYICSEKEINILVINGDVSNNYQISLNFIENLNKAVSSQVYLVPGNHDYWQRQPAKKATLLIHEYFQSHQLCLVNQVIRLKENYLLLASPGWYNHHYYNRQKF
ncbi:hypothetical protein AWM75_03830 [Aerococcus urinaehominis]|uniref:Calcineurin-like phosphoesterase domain-containing protein n=1 Tax=Aerococcus urinaehominis TaxID=128944 RepID=A0A109RGM9_9LACT|nr:metallophosphoesterase [Aerococcus urinaehominis]AMB99188.1 hypothetical protein AWM75_03830 [Aerococcus urinaehominis]SDM06832.1 Calcineurin-like phosphoesterase [Aerococcus urinaehominis]